jgi:coproporphyrinogen III oxidase-like Fe-S oxidoreductase
MEMEKLITKAVDEYVAFGATIIGFIRVVTFGKTYDKKRYLQFLERKAIDMY